MNAEDRKNALQQSERMKARINSGYGSIYPVETAADNDLNGLIAELAMHGYNLRIDTDYSFADAIMRQVVCLQYFSHYSYAKVPCKLTVDYMEVLLNLLKSVNEVVMGEAEA